MLWWRRPQVANIYIIATDTYAQWMRANREMHVNTREKHIILLFNIRTAIPMTVSLIFHSSLPLPLSPFLILLFVIYLLLSVNKQNALTFLSIHFIFVHTRFYSVYHLIAWLVRLCASESAGERINKYPKICSKNIFILLANVDCMNDKICWFCCYCCRRCRCR